METHPYQPTTINKNLTSRGFFYKLINETVKGTVMIILAALPESVDGQIKQQRQEHLTTRIMDPAYLKQAGVESLQWIYEHIHFLLGPIPKGIELRRQQGTISKTVCPRYSPGRYGRIFLAGTDTMKGGYTYTMTYKFLGTEHSLMEVLSNSMVHNSILIMSIPFSSFVYYIIVKKSDIHYAQENIFLEKMAKLDKRKI